jgi:hypothetical protein
MRWRWESGGVGDWMMKGHIAGSPIRLANDPELKPARGPDVLECNALGGLCQEETMTAFNAVRFKVRAGRDQQFLDAHKKAPFNWPGLKHAHMIKTGTTAIA